MNNIYTAVKRLTKQEELTLTRKEMRHRADPVETVRIMAPLVAGGYIQFFRLPVGWICGECGERSTIARFQHHAYKKHGPYG
ncbi:hypothetical protein SEA_JUMBO_75 [Gordonia phage Jumbo]|uniref:Uncharacterized protein n=1 Tax=Gordonia phage Jumbo TaxID=1887650 RepID=A0A1B3B0P2_9CAUD|nr:hypothetical protein BIZ69_gp075 [Gordonia phage Jumbo]AOE44583.1 hypothetical protein SEA_JUMBO_75 [Gordonia phage Jumbo]